MCLIAITDSPRIPSVRSRQWRQQIIANSQSETLARFPIFQDSRRQTWASQPGTRPGKTSGVRAGAAVGSRQCDSSLGVSGSLVELHALTQPMLPRSGRVGDWLSDVLARYERQRR